MGSGAAVRRSSVAGSVAVHRGGLGANARCSWKCLNGAFTHRCAERGAPGRPGGLRVRARALVGAFAGVQARGGVRGERDAAWARSRANRCVPARVGVCMRCERDAALAGVQVNRCPGVCVSTRVLAAQGCSSVREGEWQVVAQRVYGGFTGRGEASPSGRARARRCRAVRG